eukprot:sb/3475698/
MNKYIDEDIKTSKRRSTIQNCLLFSPHKTYSDQKSLYHYSNYDCSKAEACKMVQHGFRASKLLPGIHQKEQSLQSSGTCFDLTRCWTWQRMLSSDRTGNLWEIKSCFPSRLRLVWHIDPYFQNS